MNYIGYVAPNGNKIVNDELERMWNGVMACLLLISYISNEMLRRGYKIKRTDKL
jgi:hypothetical protein